MGTEHDPTAENIRAVLDFYSSESQKISPPQRLLERMSHRVGRPQFLTWVVAFVLLWILANVLMREAGYKGFDPPPFSLLQGIVSLAALMTTIAVLARQNRLAKISEKRAHLDLKVTMLTEQKTAKLIDLLEELRRDLPNVKDRHDPQAAALKTALKPEGVRAALDEEHAPEVP